MLLPALSLLLLANAISGEENNLLNAIDAVEGSGLVQTNSIVGEEGSGEGSGQEEGKLSAKMLISVILKSITSSLSSKGRYETLPGGKLTHDMRTFVNVTFDWSDENGANTIPQCHEEKIRKSYYQLFTGISTLIMSSVSIIEHRTGHLVYPMKITVVNGSEPQQNYYGAGVHKLFAYQDVHEYTSTLKKEPMIQLVIISEKTWQIIWRRWRVANRKNLDLCDGGRHFDNLIPRINRERMTPPQYFQIVQDYTDLTSEVCGESSCGCPTNQRETLTLAYPTEEGLDQNITSTLFGREFSVPLRNETTIQASNNAKLSDLVFDACYSKDQHHFMNLIKERMRQEKNETIRNAAKGFMKDDAEAIREINCIFTPPYC